MSFSDSDDLLIKAYYARRLTDGFYLPSLAAVMGRSVPTVCKRARKLGLTNTTAPKNWAQRNTKFDPRQDELANLEGYRKRARVRYKLPAKCRYCDAPPTDRHHKDGNPRNNLPSNIDFVCRRCHMVEDGRLARLVAVARATAPLRVTVAKRCVNCNGTSKPKPLRKGRCHKCNEYLRRTGRERPPIQGDLR